VLPDAPVPEARSLTPPPRRAGHAGVWHFILDTNPLERVNREIGRRSDVVGIYPNDAALVRLASMLLIEQNDFVSVLKASPVVAAKALPASAA
jgi:transposase-like protein